jgi:hypothetical protein
MCIFRGNLLQIDVFWEYGGLRHVCLWRKSPMVIDSFDFYLEQILCTIVTAGTRDDMLTSWFLVCGVRTDDLVQVTVYPFPRALPEHPH